MRLIAGFALSAPNELHVAINRILGDKRIERV
jgi:hypothetical protein